MARFDDRQKLDVGKDGKLYLTEPTVTQLNAHTNDSVQARGKGKKTKFDTATYTAEAKLFDEVFDEAVDVDVKDPEGNWVPLTAETLKYMPPRQKSKCIKLAFFSEADDIEAEGADDEDPEKN